MPASTMLLTLFLVGVSGTSPAGNAELPAQDQRSDPPARIAEMGAATGGEAGRVGASEDHETSSATPRRTTLGGVMAQPIIRGAVIGAILGTLIGLIGGAAAGAVMGGVVRSLP